MGMTLVQYDICDTQGRIFRYAEHDGWDMREFTRLYLNSDFCRREMDTVYSYFQYRSEEAYEFIMTEELSMIPSDNRCPNAYEIGFAYRFLAYKTGRTSAEIWNDTSFDTVDSMLDRYDYDYDDILIALNK